MNGDVMLWMLQSSEDHLSFPSTPAPGRSVSAWQLSKGSVSDLATVSHIQQTQHTGRARGATRNLNIRALTSENRYIFLSYIIEYSTCFFQKPLSPCRGSWTKPWYSVIVYSVVLWEWCSTCSTASPGVKSPPAQPRDDKVCVECNFVFGKNQEGSLQWRKCSPDWKSVFSCGQSRHFIRIILCQTGHRENILMASQDDKESESTNDLECWGSIWQTSTDIWCSDDHSLLTCAGPGRGTRCPPCRLCPQCESQSRWCPPSRCCQSSSDSSPTFSQGSVICSKWPEESTSDD